MRGTTAEPYNGAYDKFYTVTIDITHLLPALTAGMPVTFGLGNFVTNQYDVPFWASESAVQLQVSRQYSCK
jgi:hypothetical protein